MIETLPATSPFLIYDPKDGEVLGSSASREDAEAEARRLAELFRGRAIYVLGSLSISSALSASTRSLV